MDFSEFGKIGAKARWELCHNPLINHIKNNHSRLLKEKSRVIGFIMGDGSITHLGKPPSLQNHTISFYPDDKAMLDLFLSDFEKLYLKKPKVRNFGKYYSVRVNSKPACDDLRSFGDFSSLNWKFPEKLKSSSTRTPAAEKGESFSPFFARSFWTAISPSISNFRKVAST